MSRSTERNGSYDQHVRASALGPNSNYKVFPSPIPESPLRESPLVHYPPITHYEGNNQQGVIRERAGDFKASDIVYSPYYQDRLTYPAIDDLPNSLAPIEGVTLYHAPVSVASMKVRMALYEKEVQWHSRLIDLHCNEQLSPTYCNINPRATLPTLSVDGRVTTDDRNCLYYIDKTFPGVDLTPHHHEEKDVMEYFIDLIDRQNLEALAYGKIPGVKKDKTHSPFPGRRRKIQQLLDEHATNHNLVEIYRVKESLNNYQEDIINDPNKMRMVFGNLELCLMEMEHQLASGPFARNGWLASERFSLADIHALCLLKLIDIIGMKRIMGHNTLRYYEQGKTRDSFGRATDDWYNPFMLMIYMLFPERKDRIIFFSVCGAILLGLLALAGFGLWKFFAWLFTPKVVPTVAPKFTGLRADVINVVEQSAVAVGKTQPWAKWCLFLFPLMLLVPLFLWFCGCLKCKKRRGRTAGDKSRPATLYDQDHHQNQVRSRSIESIEAAHDRRSSSSEEAAVIVRHTEHAVMAQDSDGDIVQVTEIRDEAIVVERSISSSSLQKIVNHH